MRRYCIECEHWLTDEHRIVGRCALTKTQTGLHCSCSDCKPRRLQGRCYEVQDWGGDTLFYERSQMEVAYRTGIGQKKLQEALKNTDKAIIDNYIIIKHNERD